MAEWHDDGLSKQERYAMEKRRIDQSYKNKMENRSFFVSKREIEDDHQIALRKLDSDFYGARTGGCLSE